jgi:hypothetical protein
MSSSATSSAGFDQLRDAIAQLAEELSGIRSLLRTAVADKGVGSLSSSTSKAAGPSDVANGSTRSYQGTRLDSARMHYDYDELTPSAKENLMAKEYLQSLLDNFLATFQVTGLVRC